MKINRIVLYRLYMDKISNIADTCDWKTYFTPDEIINILSDIIEDHADKLIDRSDECMYCGKKLSSGEQCYCMRDE